MACNRAKLEAHIGRFRRSLMSFSRAFGIVAVGFSFWNHPICSPPPPLHTYHIFFRHSRLFCKQQTMSSITPAERRFKVTRSPRFPHALCIFTEITGRGLFVRPQHGFPPPDTVTLSSLAFCLQTVNKVSPLTACVCVCVCCVRTRGLLWKKRRKRKEREGKGRKRIGNVQCHSHYLEE